MHENYFLCLKILILLISIEACFISGGQFGWAVWQVRPRIVEVFEQNTWPVMRCGYLFRVACRLIGHIVTFGRHLINTVVQLWNARRPVRCVSRVKIWRAVASLCERPLAFIIINLAGDARWRSAVIQLIQPANRIGPVRAVLRLLSNGSSCWNNCYGYWSLSFEAALIRHLILAWGAVETLFIVGQLSPKPFQQILHVNYHSIMKM